MIEVMVYGLVFALFLLLVTQVFLTINSTSANSLSMNNLQDNYLRIFSDFEQTIRQAANVAIPPPKSFGATLSLNNGAIVYQLDNGTLQKVVSGVPIALNDSGVSVKNLNFENIGEAAQTDSIRIKMNIQSNYFFPGGKTLVEDFQTTVNLR